MTAQGEARGETTVSDEDIKRAICCPEGCVRLDDCWASNPRAPRHLFREAQYKAILNLIQSRRPERASPPLEAVEAARRIVADEERYPNAPDSAAGQIYLIARALLAMVEHE